MPGGNIGFITSMSIEKVNRNGMLWPSHLMEKMIEESMSQLLFQDNYISNPISMRHGKTMRNYLDSSPCTTTFLYMLRVNESFKKIEKERLIALVILQNVHESAVLEECNKVILRTLNNTKYGTVYPDLRIKSSSTHK